MGFVSGVPIFFAIEVFSLPIYTQYAACCNTMASCIPENPKISEIVAEKKRGAPKFCSKGIVQTVLCLSNQVVGAQPVTCRQLREMNCIARTRPLT